MDIDVNCNNIKKRSALSSKANSRSSLISSSTSSMPYHEYMDMNNNILDDNIQEPIDSSQLSYKNNIKKDESVSKIADINPLTEKQHVSHETPALKTAPKLQDKGTSNINTNSSLQETFNIQLLYNVNQALDQDI